jgi:hypothetical protein
MMNTVKFFERNLRIADSAMKNECRYVLLFKILLIRSNSLSLVKITLLKTFLIDI